MYGGGQQGGDGRAGMMGYVHAAQQHQMMMHHHHMQQHQQYHNMGGDTGSVTSATSRSESESDRSIQSDRSSAVSSGVAQHQMHQQRAAQQQPHADAQGSGGWYGGQRGMPAGAGAAGHNMRPQAADTEYNARCLPRSEHAVYFFTRHAVHTCARTRVCHLACRALCAPQILPRIHVHPAYVHACTSVYVQRSQNTDQAQPRHSQKHGDCPHGRLRLQHVECDCSRALGFVFGV